MPDTPSSAPFDRFIIRLVGVSVIAGPRKCGDFSFVKALGGHVYKGKAFPISEFNTIVPPVMERYKGYMPRLPEAVLLAPAPDPATVEAKPAKPAAVPSPPAPEPETGSPDAETADQAGADPVVRATPDSEIRKLWGGDTTPPESSGTEEEPSPAEPDPAPTKKKSAPKKKKASKPDSGK